MLDRPGMKKIMPESIRSPKSLRYSGSTALGGNASMSASNALKERIGPVLGTLAQREMGHAELVSEPVRPNPLAYWRIYLTGKSAQTEVALKFRSEASGAILSTALFKLPAEGEWRRVYLKLPEETFRLIVPQQSPGEWLGWSQPVEVSTLSYWTEYIVRRWWILLAVGSAMVVAGFLVPAPATYPLPKIR